MVAHRPPFEGGVGSTTSSTPSVRCSKLSLPLYADVRWHIHMTHNNDRSAVTTCLTCLQPSKSWRARLTTKASWTKWTSSLQTKRSARRTRCGSQCCTRCGMVLTKHQSWILLWVSKKEEKEEGAKKKHSPKWHLFFVYKLEGILMEVQRRLLRNGIYDTLISARARALSLSLSLTLSQVAVSTLHTHCRHFMLTTITLYQLDDAIPIIRQARRAWGGSAASGARVAGAAVRGGRAARYGSVAGSVLFCCCFFRVQLMRTLMG